MPNFPGKYISLQFAGLETPENPCFHLENAGFCPIRVCPILKTGIVRASQYISMFDNEYKQLSSFIKFIVVIAKEIDKRPLLRGTYSFIAGILDTLLGKVLPFSWAQLLLVCYEKK